MAASYSAQEVLVEDPVAAVLHPGHAERLGRATGKPADLAGLAREPWLTPGPETSCYEMIQRTCGAAGFVPGIRVGSSDFAVLTALVAAGAGVAPAPRLAVPEGAAGRILAADSAERVASRPAPPCHTRPRTRTP